MVLSRSLSHPPLNYELLLNARMRLFIPNLLCYFRAGGFSRRSPLRPHPPPNRVLGNPNSLSSSYGSNGSLGGSENCCCFVNYGGILTSVRTGVSSSTFTPLFTGYFLHFPLFRAFIWPSFLSSDPSRPSIFCRRSGWM